MAILPPQRQELRQKLSHDVPDGGPPPHIHHREDETFQVLEGDYEWTVGGKTFIAQKGATIFAPRGVPHTYRYLLGSSTFTPPVAKLEQFIKIPMDTMLWK